MSFLKNITAQRIAAEDGKISSRMEGINSLRLEKIFTFLLALIAGKIQPMKELVKTVTDAVLTFVSLGGLSTERGVEVFRAVFIAHPDKFYAPELQKLWGMIVNHPDLQDHLAAVYYARVVPQYVGPTEHFHWAVKSLLNILAVAKVSKQDMKFVVDEIILGNHELLGDDNQTSVWNLLSAVKESGEYHTPRQEVRVAQKDKVLSPTKGREVVARQTNLSVSPEIDGHNKTRPPKAAKHMRVADKPATGKDMATQLAAVVQ
ncbi:MAG: hypothetical protein QG589_410 [Patescibacteria group bacterium]|jgi:hypothetical protein|nr:hypothetical protein [Patescibacteria group bacterium]